MDFIDAPIERDSNEPFVLDSTMKVAGEDQKGEGLIGSAAADAASRALSSLQTTLDAQPSRGHTIAGKTVVTSASSLTIEDMVRQEARDLVRGWLDTHLPPMVEAMVRTEITRISSRR